VQLDCGLGGRRLHVLIGDRGGEEFYEAASGLSPASAIRAGTTTLSETAMMREVVFGTNSFMPDSVA